MAAHYERRLPHWDTVGEPLFVTFRLYGSLPANRVFPPEGLTTSGQAFVAMDRLLDTAQRGPFYLRRPEIAELIVSAVIDCDQRLHRYDLHAFVVMPNHVHLLATPCVISARWLGPLKGFTAHAANAILGSGVRPFWQDESYDHLVRSSEEFRRIRHYIEWNPVKAGLAPTPAEFPWSSARGAANPGCSRLSAGPLTLPRRIARHDARG